jgi:glutamate synthase domain-containing protein 2
MSLVQDSEENREKCICKKCPSYPRRCEGDILYCALGASGCHIDVKGCICNFCPVYANNKLEGLYFCDKQYVGTGRNLMRKRSPSEDLETYGSIVDIKDRGSGVSVVRSMGSQKKLPFSLKDLHFIPAQVYRMPLNRDEKVDTKVIIGPKAKKPLTLSTPIIISGMSYGAVSKNVKLVIARVAKKLGIGFNSGEGGIIKEDLEIARDYLIGQYASGRFGVSEGILSSVAAIEIKFGQGAYPGKGSYLPAEKIPSDVARVRGLEFGEASYTPARHPDMSYSKEIRGKVSWLRSLVDGRPIGAKIGCGEIEKDIEKLVEAKVDFISIDGFGGGTGATNSYIRENVGIPLAAALPRAYNHLCELGLKERITLIAGGGLRDSADFARCLALGADAVYIGTAALIAINCEQYRICHTGLCPTGVTTHNPALTKQLDVEKGVKKLSNFINISTEEIANLARIIGKNDLKTLCMDDLISLDRDLAEITGARWVNGKHV